jgi:tellurite resistance protein TerC
MNGASFPLWAWLAFVGLVLTLLVLDLFVFHREAKEVPFGEALWLSAFWIAISLAFGGFIWYVGGGQAGEEYLAAYLIEKSLSVDNVFVFSVIFSSFAVPKEYRYHVLFYGVIGAIAFRAIFVVLGIGLLSAFTWLVFVFGAFLILTGLRMFRREGGQSTDYRNSRVLRLLRRYMPLTEYYHGDNFFVSKAGRRCATPLLAALVVVEASDVIFAVDSVPAVLSITQKTFVAYSAIVFAVLGLRALYFALEGLVDRFVYLHYGLAFILVFVGGKFVAQGLGLHLPVFISLLVIAVTLMASVTASLIATRGGQPGGR